MLRQVMTCFEADFGQRAANGEQLSCSYFYANFDFPRAPYRNC